MKFGEKLSEQKYLPWSDHYIDYTELKDLLNYDDDEDHDEQHHNQQIQPSYYSSANLAILYEETANTSFLVTLNKQVERVLLFFLYQQGLIASQMELCRARLSEIHPSNLHVQVESLHQECKNLASSLLHLIQFVDLNVTGLRKILKKHDKINKKTLSKIYFGHPRKILQPLLQTESIDSLIDLLEKTYRDVYSLTMDTPSLAMSGLEVHKQDYDDDKYYQKKNTNLVGNEDDEAQDYYESSSSRLVSATTVRHVYQKKFMQRNMVAGEENNFNDSIENLLYQIHKARRELQQSSDFVNYLAASMMVPEISETEDEESLEDEGASFRHISNTLNLLSTFFYMTNYYIVAPTSGSYAAKLGIAPALGSLIIGMTPTAALVSTVLYSWWTRYSYKSALIFASTCSAIGNLLYALGLPFNSILLVLIGRLLIGFGSARSINRTYIADSFARNERTAASAWFVTAGSLGMAAGPALSSLLQYADRAGLHSMYIQNLNSTGWLMFLVWSGYLVCLLVYFRDPPRKKEQLMLQQQQQGRTNGMNGEERPLLLSSHLETSDSLQDGTNRKKFLSAYVPVATTFLIYFVLKLILECLMSSTSSITHFYFGWSENVIGFFMMALGLLMVPANLVVAQFSHHYSDRQLIAGMQLGMGIGSVIMMKLGGVYPLFQYIFGSLILFLSSNACEGPNMSLLSKTIPSSWSKGVVNVGLLSTEAGTLGRVIGDLYLTYCGSQGMDFLLNRVYGALSIISVGTLLMTYLAYDLLDPTDKDD
jgi:hypothetical protein